MKRSPKISTEMEDKDLQEMTFFAFFKGYFIYLYRFYIRP